MYSCGLVLEGGGNRGIFTSGVLDAFMKAGIDFPYVIGVSAGSCNGVAFIAKNYRRQHDVTIKYGRDRNYMSFYSLLKNGEYMNGEFMFGDLAYKLHPLNQDNYDNSNTTFCVVATNAQTGKAEYMYPDSMREFGCPILRASCSMPLATKGVEIGGVRYFDGGIADSIPIERAFDDGCEKVLVVLTQDESYVKRPLKHGEMLKNAYKEYPKLAEALLNRHNVYNAQREAVREAEENGTAFVIKPPRPLNCSSVEKNINKLEVIYQLGLQQGKKNIDAVKEFLGVEPANGAENTDGANATADGKTADGKTADGAEANGASE